SRRRDDGAGRGELCGVRDAACRHRIGRGPAGVVAGRPEPRTQRPARGACAIADLRVMADHLKTNPAIDVVTQLRGLQARGSHGLVAQLVDTLMSETAALLQEAREAVARRDREALYRAAHTLQGSAAMVGAESVADACGELARNARQGAIDQAEVTDLEAGFEAIRRALATFAD